ncbi:alpha/beta fold hydrolase [Hymenobacter sp. H14-R3]|uniref:RBBP9/YdeN family alpha/beta hydrolase n=1 Tax=Hymenobacter sp. H14-R3 TaxID=3046308 RepID=UPI0024B8B924|nr:alpha/beta fold hydrolase [Hymenobacter sp. H14-R3]MDJ0364282.1 alpha/beta fold hydrolase [Hymenobacter sp. H14-R3]
MQRTTRFFVVPGLGSSGPGHWQTYFERLNPDFTRIEQREWDTPDKDEWVATIERALAGEDLAHVVLIAHSLGCAAVAHWAAAHGHRLKGALLVAPVDVETAHFAAFPTTGFGPMPMRQLPFPSTVVASTTDEWVTLARARQFAAAWGSGLVDVGPAGHLNTASGHGDWPAGLALLQAWR